MYFLKAYHLVMAMTETKTYKNTKTQTQTTTNTKCFQDPMDAIFFKSMWFKDLKYFIGCLLVMTQTKTQFNAFKG